MFAQLARERSVLLRISRFCEFGTFLLHVFKSPLSSPLEKQLYKLRRWMCRLISFQKLLFFFLWFSLFDLRKVLTSLVCFHSLMPFSNAVCVPNLLCLYSTSRGGQNPIWRDLFWTGDCQRFTFGASHKMWWSQHLSVALRTLTWSTCWFKYTFSFDWAQIKDSNMKS